MSPCFDELRRRVREIAGNYARRDPEGSKDYQREAERFFEQLERSDSDSKEAATEAWKLIRAWSRRLADQ
jgi:hypothetical protein